MHIAIAVEYTHTLDFILAEDPSAVEVFAGLGYHDATHVGTKIPVREDLSGQPLIKV